MKKIRKIITWIITINLLAPLIVLAQDTTKLENPLGSIATNPQELFARIAGGLFPFTVILVLLWLVLGGYSILTAMGNAERYEKGKKMLIYPIIGMFIVIGSYAILSTVLTVLSGQDGPSSFKSSFTLIDPLKLSGNVQVCQNLPGVPEEKLYQRCETNSDCGRVANSCQPVMGGALFYGQRILGFLVQGLGALTLLIFIYGGFLWFTSAGNEERLTTAKKTLGYAIIGLVVVLGSYGAVSFIYSNYENLLISGKESTTSLPRIIALSPDQKVACFRKLAKDTTVTNIANPVVDYGGVCSVETAKDCLKTKKEGTVDYQIGQPDGSTDTCDGIGACAQIGYGTSYRNRIKWDKCAPELFTPLKKDAKGICPPDQRNGGPNDSFCYANITFKNAIDYPLNGWTCWRQEIGKNSGAVCSVEGAKNCAQPTIDGRYQAGKIDQNFTDCNQVGVCLQQLPGTEYRNRVAKRDCLPEKFQHIGLTLEGGTCPSGNTITIEPTDKAGVNCYAQINWEAGKELSTSNYTSACLRESITTGGKFQCYEETQDQCRIANVNYKAGKFYPLLSQGNNGCQMFGYCKQHLRGGTDCKKDVTRIQCTTSLFQPVGLPTPPWGCGYYTEIGGKCYVPIDSSKDFISYKDMGLGQPCQ